MEAAENSAGPRKPMFTIAAWFSVIVPFVAAGWAISMANMPPEQPGEKKPHLNKADSVGLAVVFAVSLVAGCVSLGGVKANGAWTILPPALLGILVSAGFEVIALIFVALSGLPGP